MPLLEVKRFQPVTKQLMIVLLESLARQVSQEFSLWKFHHLDSTKMVYLDKMLFKLEEQLWLDQVKVQLEWAYHQQDLMLILVQLLKSKALPVPPQKIQPRKLLLQVKVSLNHLLVELVTKVLILLQRTNKVKDLSLLLLKLRNWLSKLNKSMMQKDR